MFHILTLCYALKLCFEAETNHVTLAVIGVFQILVIAFPVYIMVEEDSDILYFVRGCVVFLQNFSVICLIFGPKMLRWSQGKYEVGPPSRHSNPSGVSGLGQLSSHNEGFSDIHDEHEHHTERQKLIACDTCGGVLTCKFCESLKRLKESKRRGSL